MTTFGLAVWVYWPRPIVDLPRLSASEMLEVGADPDDRRRMLMHITSILLGRGKRLSPWQSLPEPAQHVYTTLGIESFLDALDIVTVRRAQTDESPTFADVSAGYAAMDCAEMAALFADADRTLSDAQASPPHSWSTAFTIRYRALLPSAYLARVTYQRAHIEALQ